MSNRIKPSFLLALCGDITMKALITTTKAINNGALDSLGSSKTMFVGEGEKPRIDITKVSSLVYGLAEDFISDKELTDEEIRSHIDALRGLSGTELLAALMLFVSSHVEAFGDLFIDELDEGFGNGPSGKHVAGFDIGLMDGGGDLSLFSPDELRDDHTVDSDIADILDDEDEGPLVMGPDEEAKLSQMVDDIINHNNKGDE